MADVLRTLLENLAKAMVMVGGTAIRFETYTEVVSRTSLEGSKPHRRLDGRNESCRA